MVVDAEYQPSSSLLTLIEGSVWTVSYYGQIVNDDNALSGQQISREAIYQQYRLINHLEIRVQTPLTTSQDQESKQLTVTGTAITYPFMVPMEGDMFIAGIGGGREAVLRITNSEKRTYFEQSVYQIDYVLVDYAAGARRADLDRKVVQELWFERDFLTHGQNPLLQRQDHEDVQVLRARYDEILGLYFQMFRSKEYGTLVVPSQTQPVYDHFLMKAVSSMFDTYAAPELVNLRLLNCDDQDALGCLTIWDVLLQRNPALLQFANKHAGLLTTRAFTPRPMLEGVRHSGIEYVVYPTDLEVCVDYDVKPNKTLPSLDYRLTETKRVNPVRTQVAKIQPAQSGSVRRIIPKQTPPEAPVTTAAPDLPMVPVAPLVYPVLADDYYVFSEAFYEGSGVCSELESQVRDYLAFKALDRRKLVLLCKAYPEFTSLQRFYYLPVLLLLINASIRST